MICPKCRIPGSSGETFCRECGSRLVADRPDTDSTLVLQIPPQPYSPPPVSPTPPARVAPPAPQPSSTTRVILLTALATLALVGLGTGVAWLALSDDKNAGKANVSPRDNRNSQAQSNNNSNSNVASTPTPYVATNTSNNSNTANTTTNTSSTDTSTARSQIASMMNRWADSLQRRSLNDNLSFYADYLDDYYGKAVDKETVRASRQKTFNTYYSYVSITLSNVQITVAPSGSTATVEYNNEYDYRGGTAFLTGKSHNRMSLAKTGGQWLITSESHISQLIEESKSN